MRFKMKTDAPGGVGIGLHVEGVRMGTKKYVPGNIIESDDELDLLFPNKFDRVVDSPKTKASKGTPLATQATEKVAEGQDTEEASLGQDVTGDFPVAGMQDLCVFKDGSQYNVTEPETCSTPLNEKPLRKKEVNDFIRDYIKDRSQESQEE